MNPAYSRQARYDLGRLRRYPRLGKRVSAAPGQAAPEEIRDWPVTNYLVRYLIANDRVIVLRIWHGKEQRQ